MMVMRLTRRLHGSSMHRVVQRAHWLLAGLVGGTGMGHVVRRHEHAVARLLRWEAVHALLRGRLGVRLGLGLVAVPIEAVRTGTATIVCCTGRGGVEEGGEGRVVVIHPGCTPQQNTARETRTETKGRCESS